MTGAGSHQKGIPEGYRLRGHHWPERWVTDPAERRMPELFMAGELLAAGGRAVLEVMLHEASHALAVVRGIKDCSAEGNRYHNKRFVAAATEMGLRGPDRPEKVIGWSDCRITDETAAAYGDVISAIDSCPASLPAGRRPSAPVAGGRPGRGRGRRGRPGQRQAEEARRPPPRRRVRLPAAPQAAHDPQADRRRPGDLRRMRHAVRGTRRQRPGRRPKRADPHRLRRPDPVASMSDSELSDRAARSTSRGGWHECPALQRSPVRLAERPS